MFIFWSNDKNDISAKLEHNRLPQEGSMVRDVRLGWFEKQMIQYRMKGESVFGSIRSEGMEIDI